MLTGTFHHPVYYAGTGTVYNPTGTIQQYNVPVILNHGLSEDDLWERMYIRPKPVIIICAYCKCHNAISNPACVQCGAPMGLGEQRMVY